VRGGDLRHEAVVMSEAVHLGLGIEAPHPSHMHITPHKAHTHILGLGQVLQPGYQVVPLTVMLPCTAKGLVFFFFFLGCTVRVSLIVCCASRRDAALYSQRVVWGCASCHDAASVKSRWISLLGFPNPQKTFNALYSQTAQVSCAELYVKQVGAVLVSAWLQTWTVIRSRTH